MKDLVDFDDIAIEIEADDVIGLAVHRLPSRPDATVVELLEAARLKQDDARPIWRDYRPLMDPFLAMLTSFPGTSWQERWDASGAEHATGSGAWTNAFGGLDDIARSLYTGPGMGVSILVSQDALRPTARFLAQNRRVRLDGFLPWSTSGFDDAPRDQRRAVMVVQAATGKHLEEISTDDMIALARVAPKPLRSSAAHAWERLKKLGIAPADAPSLPQLARRARPDAAGIVAFYDIQPPAVRDMFIRYLRGREAALDYSSLRSAAYELLRNFWTPIRERNPGQEDLHISAELGRWWKREVVTRQADRHRTLFAVRALYLDIAAWATHDAYWAGWSAPTFLTQSDTAGAMKEKRRVQAEIHQRIRHLTPDLPRLLASVDNDRDRQRALLDASLTAGLGDRFEVDEVPYTRLAKPEPGFPLSSVRIRNERTGEIVAQASREQKAFWAWVTVHILHETGIRMEELLELTATALFTYQPAVGDKLLMLQIVPSKTDRERVLLVSPELAHVLAAVRQRVRGTAHQVPLAVRYDDAERLFSAPLPFLFQSRHGTENRVFSNGTVRGFLRYAVTVAGIGDGTATLAPHDFRRMFATDALRTGLPVHILSKVLGHQNLSTTQGYAAVFDEDVARHFREFVDRRRTLRPAEDYREATAEEIEEFQGHFTKRKVELGSCSRGYGTPCIHEHACIRCPMLRPDPVQRRRLETIRANLVERSGEAKRMGWLGELEGIEISLRAADEKLAQMTRIVSLTLERRPPAGK